MGGKGIVCVPFVESGKRSSYSPITRYAARAERTEVTWLATAVSRRLFGVFEASLEFLVFAIPGKGVKLAFNHSVAGSGCT